MQDYLVLARKYRPSNFTELKGQDYLVRTLVNAIKLNRFASTFLLTGIRGSGKTTSARIIAKTINCSNPIINEDFVLPCEKCANCLAIQNERHPDIIELDAASRTGVNDIREIIEDVIYLPQLGKYKIFIVDEVHMLSSSAFNALLKTLEEPPAQVKFIFATTELRKIPLTIVSRCQKFNLRRLTISESVSYLKEIVQKENVTAEDSALQLIASHAEGSVRDSLSLLDMAIANCNSEAITLKLMKELLGAADFELIYELINLLIIGNVKDSLKLLNDYYYQGKDLSSLLHYLMQGINNIAKAKHDIYQEFSLNEQIKILVDKLSFSKLAVFWTVLTKFLDELNFAANQLISFEMLIMRLCYLSSIPTPGDLINQISLNEPQESPKINLAHNKQAEPILKIANFEELVNLFYKKREMLLYHFLVQDVKLVDFNDQNITLNINQNAPNNFTAKLVELLNTWTGSKWNITIIRDESTGITLNEQILLAKENKIKDLYQQPIFTQITKIFPDATIQDLVKESLND